MTVIHGLIILGFVSLLLYGRHIWRAFKADQRENYRVQPDQEREQWNQLWDHIAMLPEARRIAIRNGVQVLRFNSTLTLETFGTTPSVALKENLPHATFPTAHVSDGSAP